MRYAPVKRTTIWLVVSIVAGNVVGVHLRKRDAAAYSNKLNEWMEGSGFRIAKHVIEGRKK